MSFVNDQCEHSSAVSLGNYDLDATLDSGQAFRWLRRADGWEGVIDGRWIGVQSNSDGLIFERADTSVSWPDLARYFQTKVDLESVFSEFPDDPKLERAIAECRGLRLLRQPAWECLASFILSSSKQIVQIRQIVESLARNFGDLVAVPVGVEPRFAFPSAERIAGLSEDQLRSMKMGYRAPYLLETARMIAGGEIDLARIAELSEDEARSELLRLPGVGRKIADCVLLFAYGFPRAFPVDVWVMKALKELYFPRRKKNPKQVRAFVERHFGAQAGYAQQYLFHYMRVARRKAVTA